MNLAKYGWTTLSEPRSSVMSERIIFVDENDTQVGVGSREEAWANGIYVRIVRAILRDEHGRILSQHRSALKKSYPERWTDSASGHVDSGETCNSTIEREMSEEIGISTQLTFIGKFKSEDTVGANTIREFNTIYEGTVDSTVKLILQTDEVSEIRWFELDELKSRMARNPSEFTPGFRQTIELYY